VLPENTKNRKAYNHAKAAALDIAQQIEQNLKRDKELDSEN